MRFKELVLKFRFNIFFVFLAASTAATAQVYNNSGTIRIMNGTSVFSKGSFTNQSGTIINDGKIEIEGDFSNSDKYYSTSKNDTLSLSGPGKVVLNSGLATIGNLRVNKTNGGGVVLTSNAAIGSTFDLVDGGFSTNPSKSYELLAPVSAAFAFGPTSYISGKVRRTNWTNGSSVIFNHAHMTVKTVGGAPPTSLLVNMIPGKDANNLEGQVNRYFYFSPIGGANYTADVTFPYTTAELNTSIETHIVPWYYDEANQWNQKIEGNIKNTVLHYLTSTGITASMLANREWKLAEMRLNNTNRELYVYPIPARNTLNLVLAAEKNKKVIIDIVDVSGKVARTLQKDVQKGLNKLQINIDGLTSGHYILKVGEGGMVKTKAVLID